LPFFRWLNYRDNDISTQLLLLQSQADVLTRRLAIQKTQCEEDIHDLTLELTKSRDEWKTQFETLELKINWVVIPCLIAAVCIWCA